MNFIFEETLRVANEEAFPSFQPMPSGATQGAIIGPLTFLVYTTDNNNKEYSTGPDYR